VAPVANPFGDGSQPVALAHRGGAREAVENSRTAFHHALDLGLRWIETDVRASRDGHAIVFHDATLDRTTDGTGPLDQHTLAQLRDVHLADGQPPLTLAEALATWPAARFNVDVKCAAAVGPFLRAVAEADAWDRVCAASFSSRRLRLLRRLAPGRLATSVGTAAAASLVLGRVPNRGACAVQLPPRPRGLPLVTARLVTRAHDAGLAVHVWTVDDPAQMRGLLDLGVDGIVTDRPSVLATVLAERGAWPQR
jgi:glycerophosphoryl diester phosphodiesterase